MGVVTLVLYIANDWVMHAMFRNGASASGVTVAGVESASRVNLAWQMAGYGLLDADAIRRLPRRSFAMCGRGELADGRARLWALCFPCAATVILICNVPALSQDVFSYMAHGFLALVPGGNPLLLPAEAAAGTALGPHLAAVGWHGVIGITPYGIVWTQIEVAVMKLCGTHVAMALILLKSVAAAASLGTAFCIWIFLGHVSPSRQLCAPWPTCGIP